MIRPNFVCPLRIKRKFGNSDQELIVCSKLLKKPIEKYKDIYQAQEIMCLNCYYCPKLRRWENSNAARKCRLLTKGVANNE